MTKSFTIHDLPKEERPREQLVNFGEQALSAQEDFSGLWGSCGETRFDEKCLIKGNIDRMGQKYYHLPGDKYYSQTKISPLKEDKWLCTIEEAEAKNFQRALYF